MEKDKQKRNAENDTVVMTSQGVKMSFAMKENMMKKKMYAQGKAIAASHAKRFGGA